MKIDFKAKNLHNVLIIVIILLVVLIVYGAKVADSVLVNHSNQLVKLKAQQISLNYQQSQLITDKQAISKYQSLNEIAESVVPQDKDQAEAVIEIVNLAQESGINQLSSITFPASTLGISPSTSKSNKLTQVQPVSGVAGVYDLKITVSQQSNSPVPYSDFINFLNHLEQNRRTAEVDSINIQPSQNNPSEISFTLVIDEFIRP